LNNNAKSQSGIRTKTPTERSVRQTLRRIYLGGGMLGAASVLLLFLIGKTAYHQATYIDPVTPDYSLLDTESDTYWTERSRLDIETARQSAGTDEVRQRRLRRFTYRTINEALALPTPYARAQAATSVAMVLAQHDIDIILDNHLQQLGETYLIASMRARAMISQALMYIRLGKNPAAQVAMQRYNRLSIETDLKLNSPLNEESFFGAVTVLKCLGDEEGLQALFERTAAAVTALSIDQQMKAYRLIAGEQVRVGMIPAALATASRINNPLELSRGLALILQYAARPPSVTPVEPTMLDLLANPPLVPPPFPLAAEQALQEICQYLAGNKDINVQTVLLQRIAGSRLMCDRALYDLFRHHLAESEVIDHRVKRSVLKLLDDPESPTIRTALNMLPRSDPAVRPIDSAMDDWTTSDELIVVEPVDIDPTPLRSRNDQQWVQVLLAIAQGYQSVKRFHDADRMLKKAFAAAQKFTDQNVRAQFLLRIGEQQVGADAQKTFAALAPVLNPHQKSDLARLQIISRLFGAAHATISGIEPPELREYVGSFLLQEQIRIGRLEDAETTLALMPQGGAAAESRSRLNIAKGQANHDDFATLGITVPAGNNPDWERYGLELVQQGFLHLADQASDSISDTQKRINVQTRIGREYLLLYQALNDINDPDRTIRQEVQQAMVSLASRTNQPVAQTTILTDLLMHLVGQLQTEADREDGKRLWTQAIDSCRTIALPADKATLFAKLIVAKNLLDALNLQRKTMPLFTRETLESAFEATDRLINECLALANLVDNEEQQGTACVHLAMALVQVGRTRAAQTLLDRVLEMTPHLSHRAETVSMLLAMIPTLKAMDSADTIPIIYRLAIDAICQEFTNRSSGVDVFDWRMRDSEIEQIIRSQMENGFVDDAVGSTTRLNEPVLRDRLLRTAAYIYLDHADTTRAELAARRMTVKEIQNSVLQNIQIIERRSKIRPSQEEAFE